MTPQEILEGRVRMVEEARSWIGTPYRVGGMVKGAGCCCGSLVLAVFQACGRALGEKFGIASSDCWQHWKEEQYQFRLMKHAVKIAEALTRPGAASAALPGCIALVRVGSNRCYNHAGIVTEWPMVVHSVFPEVAEVNASRHPLWAYRHVALFDPFAEKPAEMAAAAEIGARA